MENKRKKSPNPFSRSHSLGGFSRMIIGLKSSTVANFSNLNIENKISEEEISTITKASVLNLSGNYITGFTTSFIENEYIQNIKKLDLTNNNLSKLPKTLKNLMQLQKIILINNNFNKFPTILDKLPKLKYINLSGNYISTLPKKLNSISITSLIITDNKISHIPVNWKDNKILKNMDLHNNPILIPPLYILEKGWNTAKKYMNVLNDEEANAVTKFEFRFVAPFTTANALSCGPNSITTYLGTHVYIADEIKKWKLETTFDYYYTMQIGLTMDQGRRNYMEDRAEAKAIEPFPKLLPNFKIAYIGVYDGHGGSIAVNFVLENLRKFILEEWKHLVYVSLGKSEDDENIESFADGNERDQLEKLCLTVLPSALTSGFNKMQEKIELNWKETGYDDGSTAVVTILVHNKLFSAHCGDSRAVLCRAGRSIPITIDHKPNNPKERERIEKLGGVVKKAGSVFRVDNNLAVARSFGDCRFKPAISSEAEVSTITLSPADSYLILASDGLWDVVSNADAAEIVLETMNVKNCSEQLLKTALQRDSGDNISIVVIALRWNIENNISKQYLNDIVANVTEDIKIVNIKAIDNLHTPRAMNSEEGEKISLVEPKSPKGKKKSKSNTKHERKSKSTGHAGYVQTSPEDEKKYRTKRASKPEAVVKLK